MFNVSRSRSEFDRRRASGVNDSFGMATAASTNEISEEDREIAKSSPILEPFNKKINNLGPKNRDNWLKKIQQAFDDNRTSIDTNAREQENPCAQMEYDIFTAAKNLIIYQANCMKKINEIKKFTNEKRSFVDEYVRVRREKEEKAAALAATSAKSELDERETMKNDPRDIKLESSSTGSFTSALSLFKTEELVIETR